MKASKKIRTTLPNEHHNHQREHNALEGRRDFLKNLGLLTAGSIALSGIPINSLMGAPLLNRLSENGDRKLILIRLKGGNDGLNTIVPHFDYGTYAGFRPNLKIPQSNLLPLDSKYSLPNFAGSLKELWDNGMMKVIHNVGYPDQDLSHFVATDHIDSAFTIGHEKSGWLGRLLWEQNPNYVTSPPIEPLAIHVGGDGNILFFNQDQINMAMNVTDPVNLYNIAQTGGVYPVTGNAACYYQDQLDFIKSMINSTYVQSSSIHAAFQGGANTVNFPTGLGESLAIVSRLIKGGLTTRIYMLTIDGFDTHARQDNLHPQLITELGDSIKAFFADLQGSGMEEKTLIATFSEFGRRVNDNFSMGTDHGTAAPWLVFGTALNGNGFIGDDVNLSDLDLVGNLKHSIDFREIYSTLLQDWLCTEELLTDTILGNSWSKIELGFSCVGTSVAAIAEKKHYHQVRYLDGRPVMYVTLPESGTIHLQVYDLTGRKVITTGNEYYGAGSHFVAIPGVQNLPYGAYAYQIIIRGNVESGKFQVHR